VNRQLVFVIFSMDVLDPVARTATVAATRFETAASDSMHAHPVMVAAAL